MKTESTTTRIKANPERWQRLKVILADALEQTSFEERTAMLRRSCADDKTLLREAEKLLAHDTTAFEEFAEFAATRLRHDERDRIGERIGAYAIVRELGRGGMGAVYLAKRADGEFEKRVAIKVLKRGTDTDEVLRRFRTERQILANLEHPNITRLLDAGSTTDGLPYFVMEFIEGTPITRFVECENVNVRDRLKLFLKVCSAVEFAHQNQIVHRDIKPSNVLVKHDGEPKLLDFGIAKLLSMDSDDAATTVAAERRLTPLYAAPEQRAGRPATMATDMYSLGALLYELLTAHPPFSRSNGNLPQEDVLKSSTNPQLPSQIVTDPRSKHQLQGELDQIVVRAMQHDPAQRYSSATGLCQDIERYLNRARPDAKLYSATATGSRRRWYIAAMTFAGIGLAAALLLPLRRNVSKPGTVNTATSPASETSTNAATNHSIAVLPFESLSEDKSNAYFADGIQDEILARLSKIGDLKVISRTSTQKYKSAPDNLREIAQQLGVANILEGSVQKAGDQVRIRVQLINAIKDDHLWGDTYDRKMTDIFAVETDVAQKIASSLEAKLTGREKREIAFVGTKNPEAYNAVLHALALRGSQRFEDVGKAREFFQRAVELDPNYAQAWAFLGGEDAQLYFYPDSSAARKEKARTEVETALRLAPDLVEAHNCVGVYKYYCLQDYDGAIAEWNIARERSPNDWSALVFTSLVKRRQGKFDDSIRVMQQAAVLDPLNEDIAVNLGRTYRGLRQFDEARAMFDRALAIVPNDPQVQCLKAGTYLAQGDADRAWQMVKDVKISPFNLGFDTYMTLLAIRRQFDEMISSISSAATRNDLPSLLRVGSMAALANTHIIKGDRAGALPFRAQAEKNRRALQNQERFPPMMYAPFIEMEARFGDRDAVKRDVKNLFEQTEKDKWEFPNSEVSAAVGYMLLGDFDRALPFLQDALSHPSETSITPSNLRLSPIWDPIRSDPRFQKLVGKQ